jgi:transcriptional regulator with XRE-family HTH domain
MATHDEVVFAGGHKTADRFLRRKAAMLSATLNAGLKAYGIGDRMRALRLKKKMGLVELARHTGLSPALLSKIERGRMYPTLPTLLRVALVFSVDLGYFLAAPREAPVLAIARRRERLRFPERLGARASAYEFESLDYGATERKLNAYLARFTAPTSGRPHAHDGCEFIFVVVGSLGVAIGGEEHVLRAGDSIYFDSAQPHGYRRVGARPCNAVVVTA